MVQEANLNDVAGNVSYWMAHHEALTLVEMMEPYCEKIEIAGSIRRKKTYVKDIEIVAIPKFEQIPDPFDLLQETMLSMNILWQEWARQKGHGITWIKTGTPEIIPLEHSPNPDGRYWRGVVRNDGETLQEGVKLDLFLTTNENFGAQYLIRTGSWQFSKRVMSFAKDRGYHFDHGYLWRTGMPGFEHARIDTPTEESVFKELNLAWVEPCNRHCADDVRAGWKGIGS